MQIESETVLTSHSAGEKAAYLGALASLATADRHADEDEIRHLREMAITVGLSDEDSRAVLESAKDTSGQYLLKCLDALKASELRYSLITDLIAVAKADESYTEDEKANIEKVARYLNIDKNQFSVLDQFVNKAADSNQSPEEISKPGFIHSVGMQNQFSGAGFNLGSMGKSIFGFLGPMLLGGMAAKALGGRRGSGGLGGALGGGLGGMLAGNSMGMGRSGMPGGFGGGLGSLITGLSRSRNNQSMGGMLGRLLR